MGLHEAKEDIAPATLDRHRGLASLMEELEAMDWYQQRIDATGDPDLKAVLEHNRDEETEHAAMSLEWLRRQDPVLDEHLHEYLFTEGSIVALEAEIEGGEGGGEGPGDGSLGIGSLRGER
ncbi:MAG TPA: encapsulin-associated ferritin-like protein [Miltoncostaeaceae bacterium]|nr:encapsulin-associated ferritin-like protein [Miltoncostaeaceae bacterium]